MSDYGTVTSYAAGTAIRPATAAEWRRTAGKLHSGDSDAYTGAWADQDGTGVYVDGGPDTEVTGRDIEDLEQAAGHAGDTAQVILCRIALGGELEDWMTADAAAAGIDTSDRDAARAECARVILGYRAERA